VFSQQNANSGLRHHDDSLSNETFDPAYGAQGTGNTWNDGTGVNAAPGMTGSHHHHHLNNNTGMNTTGAGYGHDELPSSGLGAGAGTAHAYGTGVGVNSGPGVGTGMGHDAGISPAPAHGINAANGGTGTGGSTTGKIEKVIGAAIGSKSLKEKGMMKEQ
jgi:hypothetical protein